MAVNPEGTAVSLGTEETEELLTGKVLVLSKARASLKPEGAAVAVA
jgi:hypothetical protein